MKTVTQLLTEANIAYESVNQGAAEKVFLTKGHQLIGTFKELDKFRCANSAYHGWHRHHVVEIQDLQRLHIAQTSPDVDDQLCVLLPERAHIGRINSMLRTLAPLSATLTPRGLLSAYSEAYDLIGDYCGGGERLIKSELLGIVRATFRSHQLL